jgi:hypothetical protein
MANQNGHALRQNDALARKSRVVMPDKPLI